MRRRKIGGLWAGGSGPRAAQVSRVSSLPVEAPSVPRPGVVDDAIRLGPCFRTGGHEAGVHLCAKQYLYPAPCRGRLLGAQGPLPRRRVSSPAPGRRLGSRRGPGGRLGALGGQEYV